MIVLLSGTNRPGSNTRKVTARVAASYRALGVKPMLLDLARRVVPCQGAVGTKFPAGWKLAATSV